MDKPRLPARVIAVSVTLGLAAGLALFFRKDLQIARQAALTDRAVAIAVDWEDLASFAPTGDALAYLKVMPDAVRAVVCRESLDVPSEEAIRSKGAAVVWRLEDTTDMSRLEARVRVNDGVLITAENFTDRSGVLPRVTRLISDRNAVVPLLEFAPVKELGTLPGLIKSHLVKGHVLPRRELLQNHEARWEARLVRAVKERGVRFLFVQMSPAFDAEKDIQFLENLSAALTEDGFPVGSLTESARRTTWTSVPFYSDRLRLTLALFLAVAWPIALAAFLAWWPARSPFLVYVGVTAATIIVGTAIYTLGCRPDVLMGLELYRGVKIQLIAPLVAGLLFFFTANERRALWNRPLALKHFVYVGGAAIVMVGLYLLRSGNAAQVIVSDGERTARDLLERFLVARPRLKEFGFGHPLFVLGLYLSATRRGEGSFVTGGRIAIWLGLIGQISILNSFSHFHMPYDLTLLRSIHGWWIGGLISLPVCYVASRRLPAASAPPRAPASARTRSAAGRSR